MKMKSFLFTLGVSFLAIMPNPEDPASISLDREVATSCQVEDNSITSAVTKRFSIQQKENAMREKVLKSDDEWGKELTPEQFSIMRKKGTERAFTGKYWNTKEKGVYQCAGCGADLFSSETKFESGTGWPSFYAPVAGSNIRSEVDNSLLFQRTEVLCSKCDAHLGHVFDDGPEPTGLRYCINSAALELKKAE